MPKIESLRDLIACRLCGKIALAVFTLILAVESVILVPSYRRFEQNTLRQIADGAIIATEPTLAASTYGAHRELLASGVAKSIGQYGILGALVAGRDSEILATSGATAGLKSQLDLAQPMGEGARRSDDGASLDVAWPSAEGLKIAVRVDTSRVAGETLAFALPAFAADGLVVVESPRGATDTMDRLESVVTT